ncbi:MAG: prepilin peptidase [Acidobacteria bacterium]|nr:prepilin peptidase [Acidobacteriota bacterium]
MFLLQIFPAGDSQLLPFPVALVFVTAVGALIGSFLNVVIHRVPREESIVFPNSRCPSCGTAIRPYDNVPVLSWLVLRGRCRSCRTPITARYPAVEALTAALFALVLLRDGVSVALLPDFVFVAALVSLVFIDAEHMILPDVITLPGFGLALVARVVLPNLDGLWFLTGVALQGWPDWAVSLAGALVGALAGGGTLWLLGWLWERLRGVEAMGFGDVKMMFMVGAYLGWPLTVLTLFLAVVTGSLVGISLMLWRRDRDMQMLLPFGIFLGAGAVIALLAGRPIIDWYVGNFIP